jgi:DNA replication and repair protein RecF
MDFIGQLKVVAFCAADLETVRGEPARRRRFLDLEISQLSPSYCHTLGYYRKVTEQRSRLLKLARDRAARAAAEETLGEWTEQLVQHGSRLVERRRHFVERLQEYAQPIHALLSDQRELLTVAYRPSFRAGEEALSTTEGIQAAFRQALAHVHEEELRRQMCLVGPHRDDVTLLINGREVRTYGSQGQQRTVALSLKLAEVELMHEMSGEAPVCVLDDVFSELDARRRAHIFDVILDTCQVFLSTTDADLMPVELRRRGLVLEVSDGALRS